MSDYLNHEGRISRLEGIVEQIDKRLGTIEKVGFSILATITALLAGIATILVKLWSL